MLGNENQLNEDMYQYNAFENYIEYSCFTDQFLTGMDQYGEPDDIVAIEGSDMIMAYKVVKVDDIISETGEFIPNPWYIE